MPTRRPYSWKKNLQELLEGYPIDKVPLAVHVPMNPESAVPEGAFAGVPRLRHVSVESGIRLIGPEAWHSCRQLRIVKLPSTVVSISGQRISKL